MTRRTLLPEPFTFFVDECLGHGLAEVLRTSIDLAQGEKLEEPEPATPDEVWLPKAGARGWLCLSKDRRMTSVPNQLDAIKVHRVGLVTVGDGSGAQIRALVVSSLPVIRRVARRFGVGFIAHIRSGGEISVTYSESVRLDRPKIVKP